MTLRIAGKTNQRKANPIKGSNDLTALDPTGVYADLTDKAAGSRARGNRAAVHLRFKYTGGKRTGNCGSQGRGIQLLGFL